MTAQEKWNQICDLNIKFWGRPEKEIQKLWENIFFGCFNYNPLYNEIDTQRKERIGSTERIIPDIIIKNSKEDLFIVELKQNSIPLSELIEKQLFSYLKLLRLDIGILICDCIELVAFDYEKADTQQIKCRINFIKDNPVGIKFIEVFSKENFSRQSALKFINENYAKISTIERIKSELSADLVKVLLKNYFADKISGSEFDSLIQNYDIKISPKETYYEKNNNCFKKSNYNFQSSKGTVTIKGITFPTYRNETTSVQDFIKNTLNELFKHNLLSENEIKLLQDKNYCQKTFGIQYPLLECDYSKTFDNTNRSRYWQTFKIKDFYICSQWWKEKFDLYDRLIAEWLNSISSCLL